MIVRNDIVSAPAPVGASGTPAAVEEEARAGARPPTGLAHPAADVRPNRRPLGRVLVPFLLFLPAGLLLVLLNLLTSIFGVYLSVLDWNWLNVAERMKFVGLSHYAAVLNDPLFWTAFRNTAVWTLGVVPGAFVVGLYFALLLNEEIRGKAFFRTAMLMPWAMPLVVVAVMWAFLLAPGFGLLDDVLVRFGHPELRYANWLGNPSLAMPIVMAVQVWRWAPFFAVILLAGLQSIPSELYDAAKIDGAGAPTRFRYVTVPMMAPVAAVVMLQGIIWSVENFTLVYVMTGGGPVNATELLTTYLWRMAFANGQLGRASAAGTFLILTLSLVGVVWVTKVIRREEIA